MGLDMYLYKDWYIGANYEHRNVVAEVNVSIAGTKLAINPNRISEVSELVGYWRKANAIHQWFVDNVQDGEDECQRSYVPVEKLKELRSDCQRVLDNHDLAEELLPTQSGFFFGGTAYDNWYFQDLENTIKIIDEALVDGEERLVSFFYQSSW